MATHYLGISGFAKIGSNSLRARKADVDTPCDTDDVTNFKSGGYREREMTINDATITVEGPLAAGDLPFGSGKLKRGTKVASVTIGNDTTTLFTVSSMCVEDAGFLQDVNKVIIWKATLKGDGVYSGVTD